MPGSLLVFVFGCIAMVASQTLLVLIVLNLLSPQPVEQQVLVPVVSMLAHGLNDFFALRFGLSLVSAIFCVLTTLREQSNFS
jgi:phosphatidylinositol kinase/protein kinase (PI-3  family)